jgi:hypothetical protein
MIAPVINVFDDAAVAASLTPIARPAQPRRSPRRSPSSRPTRRATSTARTWSSTAAAPRGRSPDDGPREPTRSFSQPIGPGRAYPPPPYTYRGVEDIFVAYEAYRGGVDTLLPPGLTAADDPRSASPGPAWVPFSTFGPYHEAYVMIRAAFGGETYLYQPFIFTTTRFPWSPAARSGDMRRSSP